MMKKNDQRISTVLAGKLLELGYLTNVLWADNDLYMVTITQKGYNYLNQHKHN